MPHRKLGSASSALVGGEVDDRVDWHVGRRDAGLRLAAARRTTDLRDEREPRIVARQGANSRSHATGGAVHRESNHGRFTVAGVALVKQICQDTSNWRPIELQIPQAVVPPNM